MKQKISFKNQLNQAIGYDLGNFKWDRATPYAAGFHLAPEGMGKRDQALTNKENNKGKSITIVI